MSAIVCGKRSNYFEDLQSSSPSSPPPVSKRIRCSSSSPGRLSPPRSASANLFSAGSFSSFAAIDHLVAYFPEMDKQFLERALEECGNDLDSAIKSLNELRLSSVENSARVHAEDVNVEHSNQGNPPNNDLSVPTNPSMDGAAWVDLFVSEMTSAYNIDDAKARATRALEALERSIHARVTAEASHNLQQEIAIMKQQIQELMHENSVLKRAVSIQHERQKEYEDKSQEVVLLKQRLLQFQEQLKTLEVNNFALAMHLKASQQGSSMPGRFHPDIF